jgi:hypothetical protein
MTRWIHLLARALVMAALLGTLGAQAQIVYREVTTTGNGGDPGEALLDALETAIAQVTGQRLSSSVSLTISESTRNGSTQMTEDFRQKVEKATRGVVKSYSVLESGTTAASGRAFVRIRAVIPTYKQSEQLKRMKLALAPVAVAQTLASQSGAREFAEGVSAATEAYLTQSRKFAMIDRRFTDTSGRELARVHTKYAPIAETVKIGMRVGADYLVLAHVKAFEVQEQSERRVTGRTVTRLRAEIGVDLRVLDVATGQIKFAHSYVHPGRLPAGMTLTQLSAEVGADLGQLINTAIYPLAVVAASGEQLTFNQGGETVQVGRVYRIVTLGKALVDPYTRESLGQEETEVARAEVTAVTDRTANARVVTGRVPDGARPGSLLARVVPDDAAASLAVAAQVRLPGSEGAAAALSAPAAGGKPAGKDDDW